MKLYTLTFFILIGLFFNGCLADRIKQRMYAQRVLEMQQKQAVEHKNRNIKVVKNYKVVKSKQQPVILSKTKVYNKKVVKKVVYKKYNKHIVKKKYKKRHYVKKRKKILKDEPFSLKTKKEDPELLGPQTTMKSNPLTMDDTKSTTTNKM